LHKKPSASAKLADGFQIDINRKKMLAFWQEGAIQAGVDEAGRGCLAGPVVAAVAVFDHNFSNELINDSKKLSESQRNLLRFEIEKNALAFAVGVCSAQEIDEINILQASVLAMHRAIAQLTLKFDILLIDGNYFKPFQNAKHQTVVGGDAKYLPIAAASILAKTYRDEIMQNLALQYPEYGWEKNMGYPTTKHREAIEKFGITPYHRRTFKLLKTQTELF
jgi:ribonuclease HII